MTYYKYSMAWERIKDYVMCEAYVGDIDKPLADVIMTHACAEQIMMVLMQDRNIALPSHALEVISYLAQSHRWSLVDCNEDFKLYTIAHTSAYSALYHYILDKNLSGLHIAYLRDVVIPEILYGQSI